jgi:hypothetical protein
MECISCLPMGQTTLCYECKTGYTLDPPTGECYETTYVSSSDPSG